MSKGSLTVNTHIFFWPYSSLKFKLGSGQKIRVIWGSLNTQYFYAPGLKGPPGACSSRIVRLSVRPFVRLSVCP